VPDDNGSNRHPAQGGGNPLGWLIGILSFTSKRRASDMKVGSSIFSGSSRGCK
jgi:hypothetical protein